MIFVKCFILVCCCIGLLITLTILLLSLIESLEQFLSRNKDK